MSDIRRKLDMILSRFHNADFLHNRGLSNEVGIHIFCYPPEDQMLVDHFFSQVTASENQGFRIVECDLYEILLSICEDKRVLAQIPSTEARKGREFLQNQIFKLAPPEVFVERMRYEPHEPGDILLLTGVGKVYPYMRSHKILDNIQPYFSDMPIVMLYPGTFDGHDLGLFGRFLDEHYYRAFNLI